MRRDETRRLLTIAVRSEITRLAGEIGDYVKRFPELRKHARTSVEMVLQTPEARTEKIISKAAPQRKMSPEARKSFRKKMKAYWEGRRALADKLTDKKAAKKANAKPPAATKKRIGRPPKQATNPALPLDSAE